jgi:predicted Rossmann fold flavoprotein
MKTNVIIGAGAAGLMAAAESAKRNINTILIEKMPRCASKVRITGKGRCNVTNACFDMEDLISNVPRNPRFLYSAFSAFMPYDTMAFFEDLGVPLKIERGNRVFPQSDKAADIANALIKNAEHAGVRFVHGNAKGFEFKNGKIGAVVLESGEKIKCDSVCVCTGGKSYPATGSTGQGYALAKSAGHKIIPVCAALVPLCCKNDFVSDLQGLSLKNISIELLKNGKKVYSDFGEMLFTHFGVSGPVVLSASSHIDDVKNNSYSLVIDLKPALDEATLDSRILRDFGEFINKDFINSLSKLLPKKLIPVIVKLSGIPADKKVNEITKQERLALVSLIKKFKVDISSLYDIDTAVVTRGGVDTKQIDPKTMRSKLVENLYFAGEVIDVDAYTGGFNLQIAFSTGFLCGNNM